MKFQKYRVINSLKQSDEIMRRTFWIGLYPGLDKTNLQYTCKIIKKFSKTINLAKCMAYFLQHLNKIMERIC